MSGEQLQLYIGHLPYVGRDQPSGTIMVSEYMVGNGEREKCRKVHVLGERQI